MGLSEFRRSQIRFLLAAFLLACLGLIAGCNYPRPQQAGARTPLSPTPAAALSPRSLFGLQVRSLSETGATELVRRLGPTWVRRNGVLWSLVEPVEGERNWEALADLEPELMLAAESGMRVILIVRSTPDWAQTLPGYTCGPVRPDKLAAFAQFMEDLVRRYSAPPYNVRYWELWNEPDVDPALIGPTSPFGCWGDPNQPLYGGEYYAEMLAAVFPAAKRADPEAQILIGGLLLDCDPDNPPEEPPGSGQVKDCRSARFLEGILKGGGAPYFDGISFHAYDYYRGEAGNYANPGWHSEAAVTGPAALAKIQFMKQLLSQSAASDKYLMNTEQALPCGRTGQEEPCLTDEFERTKAVYLVHAYAAAQAQGLEANIWYSLTGWRASGLVNRDGLPQPAFEAYRFASQLLTETAFSQELFMEPDLKGYEFQSEERTIWVVWSVVDSPRSIELPRVPDQAFDYLGQPLQAIQLVNLEQAPIYLMWQR